MPMNYKPIAFGTLLLRTVPFVKFVYRTYPDIANHLISNTSFFISGDYDCECQTYTIYGRNERETMLIDIPANLVEGMRTYCEHLLLSSKESEEDLLL